MKNVGEWPLASVLRPLKILLWLLVIAVALGLLVFLRPLIVWCLNIASPFFVALIVAYIFNPVVGLLQKYLRLSRALSVVVTFLLILGVTMTFFFLLIPPLVAQFRLGVSNILQRVPVLIAAVSDELQVQLPPEDLQRLQDAVEGRLDWNALTSQLTPAVRTVVAHLAQVVSSLSSALATVVAYSAGIIAFIALVLMITFYCLIDFLRIGRFLRILLPQAYRDRLFAIWKSIDVALGGFLRGQLVVCVIIGVLYSLGLVVLGMKQYSLLIGFAAGFGNLIPYVGPIVGAVPTILWIVFGTAYTTASGKIFGVLLVLMLSVVIQTLDGFVLQPRIVGRSAGLHPLVVLAALIVGAQFGLGGLILAVPTAIVVRVLARELWWAPLQAKREHESLEQQRPPAG